MNVSTDLSVISLVTHASLLVQGVLGILLLASIMSWTAIFSKWRVLGQSHNQTDRFQESFWSSTDLTAQYQRVSANTQRVGSLERIFEAGFREFMRQQKNGTTDSAVITSGVQRAMKATYQREMDALESALPFLATVGSVSPYVGLFGTVWGIMNAFMGLSNVGQATLAQVAPGISEALVATAMGLFAAIPAVVAYNRFSSQTDRLAIQFESFMEEFSNLLQRQIPAGR